MFVTERRDVISVRATIVFLLVVTFKQPKIQLLIVVFQFRWFHVKVQPFLVQVWNFQLLEMNNKRAVNFAKKIPTISKGYLWVVIEGLDVRFVCFYYLSHFQAVNGLYCPKSLNLVHFYQETNPNHKGYWLTDCLIAWLIDWLIDWLIERTFFL